MRVSVLRGAGDLAVEERPDPVPGPHEVLVRVASVGVCGSDVHYFEHGRIGSYVVDAPLVLGHEASGVVVGMGSAVTRLGLASGCRSSRACRTSLRPVPGRPLQPVRGMRFYATPPIDGAFAELVTVHEQFAHPVPDALSDDAAALLEPLSVGLWACRKGEVGPGAGCWSPVPVRSAWSPRRPRWRWAPPR